MRQNLPPTSLGRSVKNLGSERWSARDNRSSAAVRCDGRSSCRGVCQRPLPPSAMIARVYSQNFRVDVVIRGQRRACPLEWLDHFCMRNFTNAAEFDDTLPVAEGRIEASFRVTPERFAEGLGAWLTQRGKGEGEPLRVEVSRD